MSVEHSHHLVNPGSTKPPPQIDVVATVPGAPPMPEGAEAMTIPASRCSSRSARRNSSSGATAALLAPDGREKGAGLGRPPITSLSDSHRTGGLAGSQSTRRVSTSCAPGPGSRASFPGLAPK